MSWSTSRQLLYGSMFLLILLVCIGLPAYFYFFNKPQTCFDDKQNQNELGVDCGGVCIKACRNQVFAEPIQLWARAFKVSNGVYNLVAYVQNPNVNHIAKPAEYVFKVYDKENILIGLRVNKTPIPPVKSFPIFEQAFSAGVRDVGKVQFEFTEPLDWTYSSSTLPELTVLESTLVNSSTSPKITAKIVNNTLSKYSNIEVVALVYGKDENAIASSRTYIQSLGSNATAELVFTWPNPFEGEVSKIDIVPKLSI